MTRWFRARRAQAEALACQQLVELVTDYLEGALSADLLQAFREHISACGNCTEYLRQMRRTIELEQRVATQGGSPETSPANPGPPPGLEDLLAEFRAQHPR